MRTLVAIAPTWEANPSVTKERTLDLEPDHLVWLREYAAIPQDAVHAAFLPDDVERCFRTEDLSQHARCKPLIAFDASSLRHDDAVAVDALMVVPTGERRVRMAHPTLQIVARDEHGELLYDDAPTTPYLVVRSVRTWRAGAVRMDQLVDELMAFRRSAGAATIVGDQREAASLEAMVRKRGGGHRGFVEIPWTQQRKESAVRMLRRFMREGALLLPDHATMKRQLLEYQEEITPAGNLRYAGRGPHDDHCAVLLTLAMAIEEGLLSGAATEQSRGRHVVGQPAATYPYQGDCDAMHYLRTGEWIPA